MRRRASITLAAGPDTAPPTDLGAGVLALRCVPGPVVGTAASPRSRVDFRVIEVGARAGVPAVVEPVPEDANGRRRTRRLHALEVLWLREAVNKRQFVAGQRIIDAWEATMRTPSRDLSEDRVDVSSRPDAPTAVMVERQDRFVRLMRVVPRDSQAAVRHVCCDGRMIRDGLAKNRDSMANVLERLSVGLEVLANHLML